MRFYQSKSGGRIATGKTPLGSFTAEWDASGNLIRESCEIVGAPETRPPEPAKLSNAGDCYRKALHDAFGGVPCGACESEQKRMNGQTVAQCVVEREQIIEGTIVRAKSSEKWWDRIRAKLGDAIAPEPMRRVVGECFDDAMSKASEPSRNATG